MFLRLDSFFFGIHQSSVVTCLSRKFIHFRHAFIRISSMYLQKIIMIKEKKRKLVLTSMRLKHSDEQNSMRNRRIKIPFIFNSRQVSTNGYVFFLKKILTRKEIFLELK